MERILYCKQSININWRHIRVFSIILEVVLKLLCIYLEKKKDSAVIIEKTDVEENIN